MNTNIETYFIKNYIKKEYQDRLLFELGSKKHREKAISRFAHDSQSVLINDFIRTTFSELKQKAINKKCTLEKIYVVSCDQNDGANMAFLEAIDYCEKAYMPTILIHDNFVVVKEECEGGPSNIFFLQVIK